MTKNSSNSSNSSRPGAFDARERKLARTMQGGKEALTEDFLRRARTTIAWCEAAGLVVTEPAAEPGSDHR